MLLLPIFNPSLGRREKLPQKVGRKEKLAEKVGRSEIYPPVPPPLNIVCLRRFRASATQAKSWITAIIALTGIHHKELTQMCKWMKHFLNLRSSLVLRSKGSMSQIILIIIFTNQRFCLTNKIIEVLFGKRLKSIGAG